MSANYSINQATKTLVFTGNPQSLHEYSVDQNDNLSFTSAVIPNSVSSIGTWTFSNCSSLASIHIPNSVSSIGTWTFSNCSSLASVHIPNSVSTVAGGIFCGCATLAFVHIPNSVSTIRGEAFSYCHALASIHISNSVSTIDGAAFNDCSHIHKACVPANAKIKISWAGCPPFASQTSLLRPRLKPSTFLKKKSACRVAKASYSVYL